MKKINDPFIASFPSIDLHGYEKDLALIKVKEFIYDSKVLGNYNIIIIHGKGSGVLKKAIHEYLKNDKRIEKFYLHYINDGMTIVKIIN
jgi:DNA mismatch repair protein MutS2